MSSSSGRNAQLGVVSLAKKVPLLASTSDHILGLKARGVAVDLVVLRPAEPGDNPQSAAEGDWVVLGHPGSTWWRIVALADQFLRTACTKPIAAVRVMCRAFLHQAGQVATRFALAAVRSRGQILHVHFGNFAASILDVKRLAGMPLVVAFYCWDATAAPRTDPHIYDALFREAEAVIALSQEMKACLVGLGCPEDKVRIVHLAVRGKELLAQARKVMDATPESHAQGKPLQILAACRLVEKKGLDDALSALALLRQRGFQFRYRVVGDGPLRSQLEQQARELKIADWVSFPGAMPRQQVFNAMALSDVFFLPSRESSTGDREGTPTVLIEAGAMGKPCVATDHAGTPEIIIHKRTGLLARERDVEGMADCLALLAEDPEKRKVMGELAISHIHKEFDLESQAEALENVYRHCLLARA